MKIDIKVKPQVFKVDCEILNLLPCLNCKDLISYKQFFAFT